MINKSEKFRGLLEKERTLRNQLDDCETAQFRMFKKAFKGLGLKAGSFAEMWRDQSYIHIANITDLSVKYYRNIGGEIEIHEITFEDLFDTEVQE